MADLLQYATVTCSDVNAPVVIFSTSSIALYFSVISSSKSERMPDVRTNWREMTFVVDVELRSYPAINDGDKIHSCGIEASLFCRLRAAACCQLLAVAAAMVFVVCER